MATPFLGTKGGRIRIGELFDIVPGKGDLLLVKRCYSFHTFLGIADIHLVSVL